jgi:hypothetical protein
MLQAYQNGYPDNSCMNSFRSSITLSLTCSTDRVDLPAQVPCNIATCEIKSYAPLLILGKLIRLKLTFMLGNAGESVYGTMGSRDTLAYKYGSIQISPILERRLLHPPADRMLTIRLDDLRDGCSQSGWDRLSETFYLCQLGDRGAFGIFPNEAACLHLISAVLEVPRS